MKTIRIGNGAGFWGDNLDAPRLLSEGGSLDYLTLEYLAELTMSILVGQQQRDPQAGYVTDFPTVIESLIPALKAQPDLRIVTNAGGVNPQSCVTRVSEALCAAGLTEVTLATLTGDDLTEALKSGASRAGCAGQIQADFSKPATSDDHLSVAPERIVGAHAYLGAGGIVQALQQGARIVITGRVADASLTVGPAVYEFGWKWDDWDRLAATTVAGHLIECGAQVTGGMYSDWTKQLSISNVGYPIAEIGEDGSTLITKPDGTGGTVSTGTVAEQLVYEIGDPARYLTPDVVADFRQVKLHQDGPDRVSVSGARGEPAPEQLKVSLCYSDGYAASGTLVIAGPDAVEKARHCARAIFDRVRRAGFELARTNVECLGAGDSLPGIWPNREEPAEVIVRVSAHDPSRQAVERFTRELAPLVTSGPPGVTGYTGARPRPHPVLSYQPATIARDRLAPQVTVQGAKEWIE